MLHNFEYQVNIYFDLHNFLSFCLSYKENIFDKSELEQEQLIRSVSKDTPKLIFASFPVSDLGMIKKMIKLVCKKTLANT